MDLKLHPIQSKILVNLLFQPESRFTDLNTEGVTSDHFNFHIQRLIDAELIIKNDNDLYELTAKGKEFANRFDDVAGEVEKQPKVSIVILGRKGEGKDRYYLIQKRLKHPFYGYMGLITGKIRFGETISESAARELREEAGLSATLNLKGIEHKMDYSDSGQILDDKIFFIFEATNIKGTLIEEFKGGENIWIKESEIPALENLFEDVLEILETVKSNKFNFIENKFQVKKF